MSMGRWCRQCSGQLWVKGTYFCNDECKNKYWLFAPKKLDSTNIKEKCDDLATKTKKRRMELENKTEEEWDAKVKLEQNCEDVFLTSNE